MAYGLGKPFSQQCQEPWGRDQNELLEGPFVIGQSNALSDFRGKANRLHFLWRMPLAHAVTPVTHRVKTATGAIGIEILIMEPALRVKQVIHLLQASPPPVHREHPCTGLIGNHNPNCIHDLFLSYVNIR